MSSRRALAPTLDPVISPPLTTLEERETPFPVATILFHPVIGRVGEYLRLNADGSPTIVGRDSPMFRADDRSAGRGIDDPCISRRQVVISYEKGEGTFHVSAHPDGRRPLRLRRPHGSHVEAGVSGPLPPGSVLCVGDRLMLGLYQRRLLPPGAEKLDLAGESLPMRAVKRQMLNAVGRNLPVLLLGETGTGKERVARQIMALACPAERHRHIIDCSTLAPTLIESTLFGHVRGAFTNATDPRVGAFKLADGGILFLDEIGELPEELQSKLLRAVQEGEASPLGSERAQKFNVRVIAATNRPMEEMLASGRFRRDLHSRLAKVTIEFPPLRARREDIPALFVEFLRTDEKGNALGRLFLDEVASDAPPPMPLAFMECLYFHDWPDNVRGLLNAAHQVVTANLQADTGFFVPDERGPWSAPSAALGPRGASLPPAESPREDAGDFPRRPDASAVRALLEAADWDPGLAARRIGRERTTVLSWMDRAGLRRPKDVPSAEVAAALRDAQGDQAAAARALQISLAGLHQRLKRAVLPQP